MFFSFEVSDEKVGDDFLVVSIISFAISLGAQLAMFGDTFEWGVDGKFERGRRRSDGW